MQFIPLADADKATGSLTFVPLGQDDAPGALTPVSSTPVVDSVPDFGAMATEMQGTAPAARVSAAAERKPPPAYRSRVEALDDAVNLVEEGMPLAEVVKAFSAGGFREADITAHGVARGSDAFKAPEQSRRDIDQYTKPAEPSSPGRSTGSIKSVRIQENPAGADVALAGARGVVTGFQMLADAFGADNASRSAAAGVLKRADQYLDGMRSAAAVKDDDRIADIMAEAQDGTVLEQVGAAARAAGVAPASLIAQGLGTTVPAVLAALLPGVRESTLASLAAAGATGAAMGAGTTKKAIFDAVRQEMISKGMQPVEAEERAAAAQATLGNNKDQIAIGMALGVLASTTGVERVIPGRLVSKVLARASGLERTAPGRFAVGGVKEMGPEVFQGGAEQAAQNIALQREGSDVPTWRGVAGQGTLEGLAGFGAGGAVNVAAGAPRRVDPVADVTAPLARVESAPTTDAAIQAAAGVVDEAIAESSAAAVDNTARILGPESANGSPTDAVPSLVAGADGSGVAVAAGGVDARTGLPDLPGGDGAAPGVGVDAGGTVSPGGAADAVALNPEVAAVTQRIAELEARPATETGTLDYRLNESGTLTVLGEVAAIKRMLKDAGVTSVLPAKNGVIVGKSQAQEAAQVLSDFSAQPAAVAQPEPAMTFEPLQAEEAPTEVLTPAAQEAANDSRQMAEGMAAQGEPAAVWFGRAGDGYATVADAQAAIPSRQRTSPGLDWLVERMPSGKFRLAGYASAEGQSTDATQPDIPRGAVSVSAPVASVPPGTLARRSGQAVVEPATSGVPDGGAAGRAGVRPRAADAAGRGQVRASADGESEGLNDEGPRDQADQAAATDTTAGEADGSQARPRGDRTTSQTDAERLIGRRTSNGQPASWVIRNKATGEVVVETFDKAKVNALNTAKYEAVPIADYLAEVNRKAKEAAGDAVGPRFGERGKAVQQGRGQQVTTEPAGLSPRNTALVVDTFAEFGAKLQVADKVDDLPATGLRRIKSEGIKGVRGIYDSVTDKLWIVRENIGDIDEAFFVGLHEAFHRGLTRTFGTEIKPVLGYIELNNKTVRDKAREYRRKFPGMDRFEAIEEVLADMSGEGVVADLTGWDRLVKFLKAAIKKLADGLGVNIPVTDEMVAQMVAGVRKAGMPEVFIEPEDVPSQQRAMASRKEAARTVEVDGIRRPTENSAGQPIVPASQGTQALINFWKWFGDSKVVDEQGRPMVVYHGTPSPGFAAFDNGVKRNVTVWKDAQGFYFTPDAGDAGNYSEGRFGGKEEGRAPAVMPVYLSIRNPKVLQGGMEHAYISPAQRAEYEKLGFDGVIYRGATPRDDEYIAFNPEQIKSATGNAGTFDPENADIRFSRPSSGRTPESALQRIAEQYPDLFAVPRSDADTVEAIAADVDPRIKVRKVNGPGSPTWVLISPANEEARITLRTPARGIVQYYDVSSTENGLFYDTDRPGSNPDDVDPDTPEVILNVADGKAGSGFGQSAYSIAANLAYNKGGMFIGDPDGLSDIAMRRRLEQMISSAMKFGTTAHLAPHPKQVRGNAKLGIPGLRWVYGDHEGNVERMMEVSSEALAAAFPQSKLIEFRDGDFYRSDTGRRFRDRDELARLVGQAIGRARDAGRNGAAQAGWRTLARNAAFAHARATAADGGSQRGAVLDRLLDLLPGLERDSATGEAYRPERRILYSRKPVADEGAKPAGWSTPEPTRTDKFIFEAQDGRIDLKRAQQAIKDAGREIEEKFDARLAETLYPGRVAYRSQQFLESEVKPLLESMSLNKVKLDEISDYLIARHAPERNAQVAKVNPDMPDGGAGANSQGELMTTEAAKRYIDSIPADRRKVLEAVAAKIDSITAGTRKLLVDEGLEKPEVVKAWESAYKFYAPLFKDESEAGAPHPIGTGFSVKGQSSKRATGSKKRVTDVLGHVLMQREAAITRAEKNRVGLSLYGLALANPNKEFWTTIKPGLSPEKITAELRAMGVPDEAMAGMEPVPTVRTVDPVTDKVVDRPNPMYKNLPGAITVKLAGEDRVVMLNVKNERAARLADNLKNLDGLTKLDIAGSIIGKATRWIASVNTQYNPVFGFVNVIRDVQSGVINLAATDLKTKKAKILGNVPAALIGIARALRNDSKRTEWSDLFREFQEVGGRTGYRELFREASDRTKAIEKELARLESEGRLTPGKAAHAVLDLLDDFNSALENAVRLSAYKAGIDQGMSKAAAARVARELTVDFNRKGRAGREMGPLYAFFNASAQGTARTLETLRSPAGAAIIAGGFALGAMQALMLAAAGYDDDELPEFVKTRNLIIPTGWRSHNKNYIAIPYGLGLHVLPNTGRVVTELALSGGKEFGEKVFNAVGEIAAAFNPLGGGNIFTLDGALKTAAPTVVDPFIELGFNRNFAGGQIERKPFNEEGDNRPGFARARESTQRSVTGQVYLGISKAVNTLTGGTDYEAGMASPTPERVRYLAQTVGGGVLREFEKGVNAGFDLAAGNEIKKRGIPLTGRFFGEVDTDSVEQSRFYEAKAKIGKLNSSLKAAEKAGDAEAFRKILRAHPEAEYYDALQDTQRAVSKLNKLAAETINDPVQLKRIDEARIQEMKALNDALRKLESKAPRPVDRLRALTE